MDPRFSNPPGFPQAWPGSSQAPRKHTKVSWVAAAALVVAVTALMVSIVGFARRGPERPAVAPAPSAAKTAAPENTDASDRELCSDIAPLMAEDDRMSNTWRATGDPGTPPRDAALSKYRSDTEDWAERIQKVLGNHEEADPFLRRTLQRFIDDRILYVRNARPGPASNYDDEVWADSLSAYGGPLSTCGGLGVKW